MKTFKCLQENCWYNHQGCHCEGCQMIYSKDVKYAKRVDLENAYNTAKSKQDYNGMSKAVEAMRKLGSY